VLFTTSLAHAGALHTLIDILPDNHHGHAGSQQTLAKWNIERFMSYVPNLRTIESGNRLWIVRASFHSMSRIAELVVKIGTRYSERFTNCTTEKENRE